MLTHLIHCCIDFYFFTVVNNNKKDISICNQILVCQKKKKREKEKIKKDTFSSTACMPCTIVCSLKAGVELERPKLPNHFYHGKSFVGWKVYCIHAQYVLFQGCVLTLCFGLFILYYILHTNSTSAIIQKWLGKSKTLALEGCVPLGNIHPQGQGGI